MPRTNRSINELIAAAKKNSHGLGELLACYEAYLLLHGHRRLSPKVAARTSISDVVQDTFEDAIRGFDRFHGTNEAGFTAWLLQAYENNLRDVARRAKAKLRDVDRESPLPGKGSTASFSWKEPMADQSTPSQQLVEGERAVRLAEMVEALPEMQREAVRLRHFEGWPLRDIAKELGRSLEATAGLIKRGVQALRNRMSEESWL